MPRVLLISLLALLFLVPATADGSSGVRIRGTVTAQSPSAHLVAVKASRQLFSLRVPGKLAAIRAGQRVELRGSTLRASSGGSRVLATGVTVASSRPLSTASPSSPASDDDTEDDEREITGKLMSLSPATVTSGAATVSCAVPAGMTLSGLAVGDLVEMTCDLVGGSWVVRKIELEDDDDSGVQAGDDDDDHGHGGPGGGDDDDDDDSSGPGSGDDDHGDDD
jgi:hypothetical protein